jgi:hypothetical protein
VHILQPNLAHVFHYLPACRLRRKTAGEAWTEFITKLLQFNHWIGSLRGDTVSALSGPAVNDGSGRIVRYSYKASDPGVRRIAVEE